MSKPTDSNAAEPLCLVFIPALVAILLNVEQKKGTPLTETEVIAVRDQAVCMAMPVSVAAKLEDERGYPDIVAEDAWNEWRRVRVELGQA